MKVYVVSCLTADGFIRSETCFDSYEKATVKYNEVMCNGGYVPELGIRCLTLLECEYDYYPLFDYDRHRHETVLQEYWPDGLPLNPSLARGPIPH